MLKDLIQLQADNIPMLRDFTLAQLDLALTVKDSRPLQAETTPMLKAKVQ